MVFFTAAVWTATFLLWWLRKRWPARSFCRPRLASRENHRPPVAVHSRCKPTWVLREVIHLKAICPAAGVRKVADDQGSRRLLRFAALPRKCTFTLLGHVCLTIAEFGVPRSIRTDNESMFTSRLWRRAMRWLHIRHERIAPRRPWQNGRVERLFGTIKPWLRTLLPIPALRTKTQRMLDMTKLVYNEYRPHQALGGLTPMQSWHGMNWVDVGRANEERRERAGREISERSRC